MQTLESFCFSIFNGSYSTILKSINKEDYQKFTIPKKDGFRTINYLDKSSKLSILQKDLLVKILEKQAIPTCVKGFVKGENYKSYLSPHIGSDFFVRIDIESFFPSIKENYIKNELTNLVIYNSIEDKDKIVNLICDIVSLDGSLPQGACTSPAVSNIVMARIDQRILKYCQTFDICYTRYADDLLFSSKSFNFQEKKWFLKKVKYILGSNSLKICKSKTKYGHKELVLNGYIIADTGIRMSRKRLSDLRLIINFSNRNFSLLETMGEEAYLLKVNLLSLKHRNLDKYPFTSIFQFVQFMCGYRSFLISFVDHYFSSTNFQKDLHRLINKLEKQIEKYT